MRILFLLALLLLAPTVVAQSLVERQALTLDGAIILAEAARAEAIANDWSVVIVVVDAGGHLLHLQRMDGVQLASLEIAQRKARASALYRRPTKVFADRLAEGNEAVHQLPGAIPLEGGLAIVVEGEVVGAVGVSGVRGDQDAQIGQAGIDALIASLRE